KTPAWPEDAGIQGHGHADDLRIRLDESDPHFVGRLGADRPACSFGENQKLPVVGKNPACRLGELRQGAAAFAAVEADLPGSPEIPAKQRHENEFALIDEAEIIKRHHQRKSLEEGLMLRRDQSSALRQIVETPEFELQPADAIEQDE